MKKYVNCLNGKEVKIGEVCTFTATSDMGARGKITTSLTVKLTEKTIPYLIDMEFIKEDDGINTLKEKVLQKIPSIMPIRSFATLCNTYEAVAKQLVLHTLKDDYTSAPMYYFNLGNNQIFKHYYPGKEGMKVAGFTTSEACEKAAKVASLIINQFKDEQKNKKC